MKVMYKWIVPLSATIGGILIMYGIDHCRVWFVVGILLSIMAHKIQEDL